MAEKEFYLSIVVPAFREEKRIPAILNAIAEYEKTKDFLIETIVICDGSPDDTANVAKGFSSKIADLTVHESKNNLGKGGAVREGMLRAKGKYVIFSDADNSTPIDQVDKLLAYVDKYSVIVGSRYIEGAKLAKAQPLYRVVGGRALNLIIQLLADRGIKDTQCGFKLFEQKAAKEIFSRQTILGWSFDIEILAIARKLGYKTKEVGVTWYDNPHSAVKPLQDGLRMIEDAWRVRKNIFAGKYH